MIVPQKIRLIGQPVRSLQTMLRELSFLHAALPRLTPDGVFGERTLEAVMLFQRDFFPPVTGRVDQATWDAIAAQYLRARAELSGPLPFQGYPQGGVTVEPGQDSVHLSLAQTMFQALSNRLSGLEHSPATGRNDPATTHNLRWLQRLSGQPQTGALDQGSWNALSRLYTVFITHGQ
nr:peptidoglycan-binding domain-containing protein [uncultured Flavonifractor sp.]